MSQEKGVRWFVERLSLTDRGYIEVQTFDTEGEARELERQWAKCQGLKVWSYPPITPPSNDRADRLLALRCHLGTVGTPASIIEYVMTEIEELTAAVPIAPQEAEPSDGMERFLVQAGTVVHIQGVPVRLAEDALIDTNPSNASLISGVALSWQRKRAAASPPAPIAPQELSAQFSAKVLRNESERHEQIASSCLDTAPDEALNHFLLSGAMKAGADAILAAAGGPSVRCAEPGDPLYGHITAARLPAEARPSLVHFATYGEQSASHVPTACGVECSTWDKPLQYAWEIAQTTCLACLRAYAEQLRARASSEGT